MAQREPHLSVLDDLRYDRLIKIYEELFGRENIFVLLFEDFKLDPEAYYRRQK